MNQNVPKIAFFGTKGGVGKTTITNKFGDIVAMSEVKPKILLIDFDIEARGTTILRTKGKAFSCKTIHEYIANRATEIEEIMDVTNTIDIKDKSQNYKEGRLYLIPSATAEAKKTFRTIADIKYEELLRIISSLIDNAIEKYNVSCVLIDCGPTIDPTTATAAHISNQAFIIGQNEPISRETLKEYRNKIKTNYFSDFNSGKMNIILNKVRASIPGDMGFFAVVPFTIDIVDISEGLSDVDQVRLLLLDYYIFDIVKRTFEETHPYLVPNPKVILTKEWSKLIEQAPVMNKSLKMRLYRISKWSLPIIGVLTAGLLASKFIFDIDKIFNTLSINYLIIPSIILTIISGGIWLFYMEVEPYLKKLIDEKENFLFQTLRKRSGRRILEKLRSWG